MELNELVIKQGLLEKRVSAKQMCKDINLSEPTLYRFYISGVMRVSNQKKIREYLGVDIEKNQKMKVSQSFNEVHANETYWKEKYFEVVKTVNDLTNTIQMLSLGKFRAVSTKPAYISIP